MRHSYILFLASSLFLCACASTPRAPVATVAHVDLDRFMGDWYVIASIPTFLEKGAHNAIESYRRDPDGTIATTFTFRKGSFDGPLKTMKPRGFIKDAVSNARWGMQFIWPIKAEYLISYVDAQYSQTIIARNARDYVWVMARTPQLAEADYQALLDQVGRLGYDLTALRKVPQQWPAR